MTIKGKKLFVSGEGFHQGALITVNGVDLATDNDFDKGAVILINGSDQKTSYGLAPTISTVSLLSKKAATKVAPGATAVIQVRNVYGLTSPPLSYTRPNK